MHIDPSSKRRCNSADEALLRSILSENSIKKPCIQHGRECSCSRCNNVPDARNVPCAEAHNCCPIDTKNGIHGKALGIVYSPVQCWQNLYDLEAGLSRGTIFAELDLPFEASSKGGKCCG